MRSLWLAALCAACATATTDDKGADTDTVDSDTVDTDTVVDTDVVDTEVVDTDTAPEVVDLDQDGSPADEDCEDLDPDRRPGIPDVCDGVDNDCDSDVDEDPPLLFRDADGDGFGNSAQSQAVCDPPTGWVAVGGDCDDADGQIHPGAPERCNERDDDCSRLTSEDGTATFFPQSGPWVDMTAALTGTPASPARVTLADPGTLNICYGTWYVAFTVTSRPTIQGFGHPVISGAHSWRPMTVDGGPPFLRGLVLADGLGHQIGGTGPTVGGNLYADHVFMLARDLELRGGEADIGGGAYIDGGMLDVVDLDIHGNTAVSWGGGAAFTGLAGLTMNGGAITGNVAPTGAALHGGAGSSLFVNGPLITDHAGISTVHLDGNAMLTCWGDGIPTAGIFRNTAAGVALGETGRLNLRGCDFGEGADANTDDLLFLGPNDTLPDLGNDATLICTGTTCN